MPYRKRHAGGLPRLGRRHCAYWDSAGSDPREQVDGGRICRPPNRGDVHDSDREAIEQVKHAVEMILVGVAQEDGVDSAHASSPKRGTTILRPTLGSPSRPQS